ncbi:UNVERIFIED_CONTAM: hypothetical protein Scaly_2848000 [Sesamum calycinum]|uniref:Uncharacterized protein n=1 Tax=Sesamum calycinum TaxID=2727403 RepID=A0AAW2LKM1_9LAMI
MQVVQIRSYSTDYIGTKIHRTEESGKWRFTSFYGSPEVTRRKTSWETLARLSQESFMPWLCTGDFNKVLFQQEKTGIAKPEWQICDFRNALQQSNLLDISYEGSKFTWWNRKEHPHTVRAYLDRACGNMPGRSQYPNA